MRLFFCLAVLFCLLFPGREALGNVSIVPDTIRIGLIQQSPQVEFSITGNYKLINLKNKEMVNLNSQDCWQVKVNGADKLELYKDGVLIGDFTGPLRVEENVSYIAILSGNGSLLNRSLREKLMVINAREESVFLSELSDLFVLNDKDPVKLNQPVKINLVNLNGEDFRRYRGSFEFRLNEGGVSVINELPFEEYLYGVVPAEMPSSWPEEALKAQAVAARSYALSQMGMYGRCGFDLLATQGSQVYKGYDWESPATNSAVDETRGVVMVYRGRPVTAVFHSSSGGFTENSEDVWKNAVDYLRIRSDPYDYNNKHYNWEVTYSTNELIKILNDKGYNFTKIIDLIELERTSSGTRVKRLAIKGLDLDEVSVVEEVYNADNVRRILGLKSALFVMQKEFDQQQELVKVTFQGSGWGHGLGMSQYGALGLARQGYSYQDILKYYYSGIKITKDYGG